MRKIITSIAVLLFLVAFISVNAQVKTNLNNTEKITGKGKFNKGYKTEVDFEIPAKNIKDLLEKEKDQASTNEDRAFRLATPVPVDIDIAKLANWSTEGEFVYGKFSIKLKGALSASINFDKFNLPPNSEMYIYNENGNMITGPVTEKENNPNNVWGSWVYQGEYLNVEIKTPASTKKQLELHSNNIAYGYKHVYQTETAGFGTSEPCNINVICPLGTGWEAERNSVALVLNDNGQDWCSGAMIMNTCSTNRPFFLTANHCFTGQNVVAWRFMIQAWSPTCPHPGINNDGVTYNGSTLRANWAGSDFCLVELNNTPPSNSGINYAGWNRNTTGITQTTIIHHPQGDVMKISRDNQAPIFETFSGAQCWRLGLDQGATQGGSSGSPYFDQNHRIIGQHYGINDGNLPVCQRVNKFGGRFDQSWTGGGTNATRLSNWLDPSGTGVMTTNTTNVANLSGTNYSISGPNYFCSTTQQYTLVGSIPPGVNVSWLSSNNSIATAAAIGNGSSATVTKVANGNVTITAFIYGCVVASKAITVGPPAISITATPSSCNGEYQQWNLVNNTPSNGTNWNWSVGYLSPSSDIVIYSPSSPSTWISVKGGGTVRLNYTDLCSGSKQDGLTVYSTCGGYYTLAVSPNPAQNNITVSLSPSDKSNTTSSSTTQSSSLMTIDSKGKTILSLFEMNTGLLVKQWKFNESKNQNYNLSINGLRKGVYALQADRENHSVITKLIIE